MNDLKKARLKKEKRNEMTGDLSALDPTVLRDSVRNAILTFPQEERAAITARLVARLKEARFDLRSSVIVLGINARSAEDLTPSDIGHIMRYLRLTAQPVFAAITPSLTELLGDAERTRNRQSRQAA
ncbi:MAG TPA: hypothetical protein VJX67_04665 [Blastocatellia bacterium]|nr:hypothetical protein [Blastocatellia bacterium]